MSNRNNQKQIWSDKEFIDRLQRIIAKRLLSGNPVKNIAELTKELVRCPIFDQLEKELLKQQKEMEVEIKLDKRRLF